MWIARDKDGLLHVFEKNLSKLYTLGMPRVEVYPSRLIFFQKSNGRTKSLVNLF